ncbi:CGNR zinc finger domain-containing protein [Actinomadura sp. 9N407]|uniref:CGNR zinc finger domain-containing protein n=1 Tax=Actinomadura sp. 9N407 TaxID=3375154 RepID=UPI00379F7D93
MLPPTGPEEVGGLPAGIALIHHFANTEDLRAFAAHGRRLEPHDGLASPADLERWLCEHDLLEPGATCDQDHLARARTLRTALRLTLRQDGEAGEIPLDFSFGVTVSASGAGLVSPGDPVTAALARIVIAAVTATADGTWRRLRMCPAQDCQWVFYDRSRPGKARWCSPQLCGNRMKTQAYRRRVTDPVQRRS